MGGVGKISGGGKKPLGAGPESGEKDGAEGDANEENEDGGNEERGREGDDDREDDDGDHHRRRGHKTSDGDDEKMSGAVADGTWAGLSVARRPRSRSFRDLVA